MRKVSAGRIVGGLATALLLHAVVITPTLAQQAAAQAPQAAAAPAGPAQTNCDVSGEWGARSREDTEDRVLLGTNLGDYTGFALNDAGAPVRATTGARRCCRCRRSRPFPTRRCTSCAGPGRTCASPSSWIPNTRMFIGYTLDGVYGRNDRTIWMDGRPHPPDYAEYTWDGFSTGRCERGMLVVTTTHMKYGYHRRNGVPSSVKSKMTEYFIRHGTELTIMQFTEDPVYLEEMLARTTDFQLNPGQNVGAPGLRLRDRRRGRHVAQGLRARTGRSAPSIASSPTRSACRTSRRRATRKRSYPEYLPKLRKMMAEMPAMPAAK